MNVYNIIELGGTAGKSPVMGRWGYDTVGDCNNNNVLGYKLTGCNKMRFSIAGGPRHFKAYATGKGSVELYLDTILNLEQADIIEASSVYIQYDVENGIMVENDYFPH